MVGEGRADCVHLCDIVIHGSVNNGRTELAVLVEDQVATSPQSKGISVQSADGVDQARNCITTAIVRPSSVRACIDLSPLGADEAAKEVLPANESLAAKRVVNGGSVPRRPIANHDRIIWCNCPLLDSTRNCRCSGRGIQCFPEESKGVIAGF